MERWKFKNEYRYWREHAYAYHRWTAVGCHLALHFHTSGRIVKDEPTEWYGGIETHYRTPPSYMEHGPPSHPQCEILNANCWHDGSSLQASEVWIPRWRAAPNDHDYIFSELNIAASAATNGLLHREDDEEDSDAENDEQDQ